MTKKNGDVIEPVTGQPKRAKVSAQESLRRMRTFNERKDEFIAAIRKGGKRSMGTKPV
jgi:hypothetical protein